MSRAPAVESRQKLSPPELARRWGVSAEKVRTWVRTGELKAVNGATRPGERPRFLIDIVDLAEFEARRLVVATPAAPRRRRRRDIGVTKYF